MQIINPAAGPVITDADHTMAVMRGESFGPIIAVMAFDDDDQAVQLMNDTASGLTAGIFSPDRERAEAILRRVDAGSAHWNCCDRVSPLLPWSGRGHSAMGSTLSSSGILTFTRPKAWHLRQL